jgi:polygalacturonase
MPIFDITQFGAIGNRTTLDTRSIQATIDRCSEAGGGTVLVPAGRTFLCGSIELRSHIELRVEPGATLLGATQESDYPRFAFQTGPEAGKRLWIGAVHAEDILLTGGGTIDGNFKAFALEEGPYGYPKTIAWRPAMTCFEDCKRLRIENLTFRHAANWALHFTGCDDVTVQGISILNDLKFPNCDGIDPDHSRNVRISNCHIEAGDDCIVFKNTPVFRHYGACENMVVTNCTLVSTSSAIKIGTESLDDFRNILVTNCTIRASNRGISIQHRDRGNIRDVIFSNLTVETRLFQEGWWGSGEPIYLTSVPRQHGAELGKVSNVILSNIICHGENGVFVMGHRPEQLRDILFENVQVNMTKTSKWPGGMYDVRPCPPDILPRDAQTVGQVTPWGAKCARPNAAFYLENAERVQLRNCRARWTGPMPDYYTYALEAHGLTDLRIDRFEGESAHPDRLPAQRID